MTSDNYILWDHDGVLVDTEHWYFHATQRALEELGIQLDRALYLRRMVRGLSSWDLARQSGIADADIEAGIRTRDGYYQQYLLTQDIAIPGVTETLAELAGTHRMGIVTTSKRRDFELIHRDRNIVSFMDFAIVREDYANSKPDPEPYLLGIQKFHTTADRVVAVEDSQRGLQSALAAGLDCVAVHNAFTAGHDFSAATYRVGAITEIPALLRARPSRTAR